MRHITLFVLAVAGSVGVAQAQQDGMSVPPTSSPPPSTGDLGSGRDLGTGGGVTSGSGNIGGGTNSSGNGRIGGGGVTGDTGPDRDLGTGRAGPLGGGNRLGTGGGVTGGTQTQTTIDDPAFLRLDTDRNGFIDRAEAELDAGLADEFVTADGDRDGGLSLSEFQAQTGRR